MPLCYSRTISSRVHLFDIVLGIQILTVCPTVKRFFAADDGLGSGSGEGQSNDSDPDGHPL